jgi:hypothetical protein
MATFLVTGAMPLALRARVERAVSPRARARHHAKSLGLPGTLAAGGPKLTWIRLFPVLLAIAVFGLGYASYRAERRAVAAERASLAGALAGARARLPAGHELFIATTDRWIQDAVHDPDRTDRVAPSLKGSLDAWLHRPAVYLHLPAAEATNPHALNEAALASGKDAFLLCLTDPPPGGSERELLNKVRGVYFSGAKVDEQTAGVRRLADAHVGLAAVGPSLDTALASAPGLPELRKLRRTLEGAPVADAARAAAAEVLIVVADEPGGARVAIVDLSDKSWLLRMTRPWEAVGASPGAQIHREAMQGCALGRAVRKLAE